MAQVQVFYLGKNKHMSIAYIDACLAVNPITVGNFAFLLNCTPVGQTSDSKTVPTIDEMVGPDALVVCRAN